jgi:hypothetical protein
MSAQNASRFPLAEGHLHECKDREDDVCTPRGYCECQCGAQRCFPIPTYGPHARWVVQ